jgi:hypothetical protein
MGIAKAWIGYLKPGKTLTEFDNVNIPITDLVAASAYTDSDGYFMTYPGLPRGKSYFVIVMAPNYERRTFNEALSTSDPDVIEYKPIELRSVLVMP